MSETLSIIRLSDMPTPEKKDYTTGFKYDTKKEITEINKWFADLVASRGELGRKGEGLRFIMNQYDQAFANLGLGEVPEDIEPLLLAADCKYLKYEPYTEEKNARQGFVCYEFFSQKKKLNILGTNHKLILRRCNLCKAGKLDKIERLVQTQLRKKNIKGLLDLRDILINLQIEGGIAQIYICKGELLENKKIIVSTDGIHLRCPLEPEEKDVQVKSHCYNQITPWTMEPPCQYLIDPFINVKIEPSEKASEAIERIALELQEGLPEQEAKTIEAEVIEQEGQPEKEKEEET